MTIRTITLTLEVGVDGPISDDMMKQVADEAVAVVQEVAYVADVRIHPETPTDLTALKPGDRVRLTGRHWQDWELWDEIVVIEGVTVDGPYFWDSSGFQWRIFTEGGTDYSATKINEEG